MSLRTTVAYPFRREGERRLAESEVVVALSLDRDWFSPDQAKRVVDVAAARGLIERDGNDVVARFDPGDVHVPEDFTPDESILREESVFERVLDRLLAAGIEKREAVAAVNQRQADLAVTVEAAALVVAREEDVEVDDLADRAMAELDGGG